MTPEAVLTAIRRRGVVLEWDGGVLRFRGRHGALPPNLRSGAANHKEEIAALVSGALWPPGQQMPNLYDLGNRQSAAAVRAALAEVGCNLAERDPTWEELFVVVAALDGHQ